MTLINGLGFSNGNLGLKTIFDKSVVTFLCFEIVCRPEILMKVWKLIAAVYINSL